MFGFLDWFKIGAGALAGMMIAVLFYEGVPIVKDIPYISYVPVLGNLGIGNVQTRVNAAVAGAQHGFAVQVENAALKARVEAEERDRRNAAVITDEFNKRLSAVTASDTQSSKDLDDALAENDKLRAAMGKSCTDLDDGTARLLQKHGFQVDR
jgi:hypothetical protein